MRQVVVGGSNSVMSYNNGGGLVAGSRTRYLPFGAYRTAPTQTYTDRGYTSQKHNDDLGLIYYNARYYLPGVGRFVSADTIVPDAGNPQSYNRYSYVLNRPLNFADPTGHRECGATDDCSDPLPHTSDFQEALLKAWIYYEDNFDLPFEGNQRLTQEFGRNHNGIDWGGEFAVQSPASGRVTRAGGDSPAGMWRIQNTTTGDIREWSVFATATNDPLYEWNRGEDGLLEPERLLATGEWIDLQPGWSHIQGTVIKIGHNQNLETIYYHTNPSIAAGTTVDQGDVLGVTANNGFSSGTHLHYTLRFTYNDNSIDLNPLAPPAIIQRLLTIP